jgi:hypothetical protein
MENVAVGAYSYDQVNKSFMLGLGMDIEPFGLKQSVLACPELVDYIGGVVAIRRAYPEYLINGKFVDTLGATVDGDIRYGVHEGSDGLAVVLWNDSGEGRTCRVALGNGAPDAGIVCRPDGSREDVKLPCSVELSPHAAAAIVAVA